MPLNFKRKILVAFIVAILLVINNSPVSAYYTNMPASVVVGQPDFTSNTSGTTQNTLGASVRGAFVDPKGRLILVDENNSRVLIWNQVPTTNGKAADLVLGQPDFTSSATNNG